MELEGGQGDTKVLRGTRVISARPLADIFFYTAVFAFGRKADVFALTCPEEQAHCAGPGKKGCSMALDANTFLIIFAAAIMVIAIVVWVMFKKTS